MWRVAGAGGVDWSRSLVVPDGEWLRAVWCGDRGAGGMASGRARAASPPTMRVVPRGFWGAVSPAPVEEWESCLLVKRYQVLRQNPRPAHVGAVQIPSVCYGRAWSLHARVLCLRKDWSALRIKQEQRRRPYNAAKSKHRPASLECTLLGYQDPSQRSHITRLLLNGDHASAILLSSDEGRAAFFRRLPLWSVVVSFRRKV